MTKLLLTAFAVTAILCAQQVTPGTGPTGSSACGTLVANAVCSSNTGGTGSSYSSTLPTGLTIPGYLSTVNGALSSGAGSQTRSIVLTDFISLEDYVNVNAAGYVPTRLSAPINNSASAVSVTSGSPVVHCTGCGWSAADVGEPIVILVENTTNEFQSTILSYQSATQVTLASSAIAFTSTVAFAYMGTDDTAAIDNALAAARAANKCLWVPAGGYFYQGGGLSGWTSPCILGEGGTASMFYLGIGDYLVSGNEFWYNSRFTDLGVFGGAGSIRNLYTSQNVAAGPHVILRNYFRDYSNSAVSFNSNDLTYLAVEHNFFQGLNSTNTFGVAIAGPDEGQIQFNQFLEDQFHIKLGLGGSAMRIVSNDLIQRNTGSVRRARIWLVPYSGNPVQPVFIGPGNKFGNENSSTLDVGILLADTTASSGSNYFGDTQPLTSASTNNITNLNVFGNAIVGASPGNPLVYSYTPNIYNSSFSGVIEATPPTYALQFDSAVTAANSYTLSGNWCGPWTGYASWTSTISFTMSSIPGECQSVDPAGQLGYSDYTAVSSWPTGSNQGGYAPLLTTAINSFSPSLSNTITQIADSAGGTNAATITSNSSGVYFITTSVTTNPTVGQLTWLDVEARQGSSGTSSTQVLVQLTDHTGATLLDEFSITLNSKWQRYLRPYKLLAALTGSPSTLQVKISNVSTQTSQSTVDVEFLNYYQAAQPIPGNQHVGVVDTEGPQAAYCLSGSLAGSCWTSGSGAPTGTCVNGSFYTRTDTQIIYECSLTVWLPVVNCVAAGCTMTGTGAPLTLNRTGGGSPALVMQVAGTAVAQYRGTSGGGFSLANGAATTTYLAFGTSSVPAWAEGSQITAAATIAPTAKVFHLTGATSVTTITAANGCTTAALSCELTIIPDSSLTFGTGGNIAAGFSGTTNVPILAVYDPTAALWYLK